MTVRDCIWNSYWITYVIASDVSTIEVIFSPPSSVNLVLMQ